MSDREQEMTIRNLAYHHWQQAGQPDGEALRFWLLAEQDCLGQTRDESSKNTDDVQEASEESFPASDPPAWPMTTVGADQPTKNRKSRR